MTHVQKETGVLLKEKGFDLSVTHLYHTNKPLVIDTGSSQNWNEFNEGFSAPDIYQACIWLRTKGVHVYVTCTYSEWYYSIQDTTGVSLFNSTTPNKTHDLALEAGIIHALKHYVK